MKNSLFVIIRRVVVCGIVLLISTCTEPEQATGPYAQPEEFIENAPEASAVTARLNVLKNELHASLQPPVVAAIEQGLRTYSAAAINAEGTPGFLYRRSSHSEDSVLLAMAFEAITRGSMKTALYCLVSAVLIKPDNPEYLSKTGFALAYLGRDTAAKEMLLYARSLDSTVYEVHATLATIYKREGDLPRAIFEMIKALELFPNNPYYLVELSSLYYASGKHLAAWSVFTQARHFAPGLDVVLKMALKFDHDDTTMLGNSGSLPGMDELIGSIGDPGETNQKNRGYIFDSITELYTTLLSSQSQIIGSQIGVNGKRYEIEQDFLAACTTCSACGVAIVKAAPLETAEALKTAAVYRDLLSKFLSQAMGILRRNPDAIDYSYASRFTFTVVESIEELISGVMPESVDLVSEWQDEVTYVCANVDGGTGIADSIEELNVDVGVCIVYICVTINNKKVSLQGNAGLLAINLEYDMDKKTVAFGIGATYNGWATGRIDLATNGEVSLNVGVQMRIGPSVSKSYPLFTLWSGTGAVAGEL